MISSTILLATTLLLLLITFYQNRLLKILQKSRDNFRIFVDSSPYSFLLTDKYLNIKTISKSTAELFSSEIRDVVNKNIRLFLSYDTYFQDRFGKNNFIVIPANSLKDNTPLECTIYSPSTNRDEYFWFIRNIEKDIDFQTFFQKLMDSFPLAFVKLDYKGNFINFNRKFKEIFTFKDYKKLSITVFFHWHNFYKILDNVKKNVFDFYETEFNDPNGKKYLAFYFFDSPLNESYIYAIIYDLTFIEELYVNMENLLEEQNRFSKEKDILFARMNHEIRTPLNTIIGLTEYLYDCLKKETNFQKYQEFLADLLSSSHHLLMIINEILDFNKIASGTIELKEDIILFSDLIKESILAFEKLATRKGLSYKVIYDERFNSLTLKGDKTKIKQIIYNLISNSIKFTEKGGITIKITLDQEESVSQKDVYLLTIDITDTGIGIPNIQKDGLFKPFTQLSEGEKKGGTGLGLYISRELARNMGGDITFKSEQGVGTTFTVRLRLKGAKKEEVISQETKKVDGTSSYKFEDLIGEYHALIVDDVALNRKVLRLVLEKMGWNITEASSGFECLDFLEKGMGFDVIFMDISMPDMDGIETLKRIREKNIKTPIIACTAFALQGDRDKFLGIGFDGYIPKPVTKENLVKELSQISLVKTEGRKSQSYDAVTKNKEAPIDYNELLKTCDGMEELAKELLNDLINQANSWMEEAKISVKNQDYDRIRRLCHQIRGTSSTIHANLIFISAQKLGEIAKSQKAEQLDPALTDLENSIITTIRWCEEKLQKN